MTWLVQISAYCTVFAMAWETMSPGSVAVGIERSYDWTLPHLRSAGRVSRRWAASLSARVHPVLLDPAEQHGYAEGWSHRYPQDHSQPTTGGHMTTRTQRQPAEDATQTDVLPAIVRRPTIFEARVTINPVDGDFDGVGTTVVITGQASIVARTAHAVADAFWSEAVAPAE